MLYVPIPFDVEGMLNVITSPSPPFNMMCLDDVLCLVWSYVSLGTRPRTFCSSPRPPRSLTTGLFLSPEKPDPR